MSLVEAKAYEVLLPPLNTEQSAALERWADDNCWRSVLLHRDAHTVWVALREKRRSQAAWTRHVKEVLAALGVGQLDQRNWLRLCTVQQAKDTMKQWETMRAGEKQQRQTDAREDKIIALRSGQPRGRRTGIPILTVDIVRD